MCCAKHVSVCVQVHEALRGAQILDTLARLEVDVIFDVDATHLEPSLLRLSNAGSHPGEYTRIYQLELFVYIFTHLCFVFIVFFLLHVFSSVTH